ncbi:MAG: DUF1638 domain-containing protein [Candidatus Methanomethylophilaceae archaeon]|jgi:hypothetical protein
MTKGSLGVIACPMLEDELIYSLTSDMEKKHVYVVDVEEAGSLKYKMGKYGVDYDLMSEYDLNTSMDLDPDEYSVVILMNKLGLHAEPKDLKAKVEEEVLFYGPRFDVLAMYYGLCGNYGWDISKWAKDRISTPVTIFRDEEGKVCDDCIGVAVGGTSRYLGLIKKYTGMLFLTPSMATNWEDFLGSMDLFKGSDKSDKAMMRMIFEMCGYQYAVKIDTGLGDREHYQECAEELCREMNLKLITAEDGWATLGPAKRLYTESKKLLDT